MLGLSSAETGDIFKALCVCQTRAVEYSVAKRPMFPTSASCFVVGNSCSATKNRTKTAAAICLLIYLFCEGVDPNRLLKLTHIYIYMYTNIYFSKRWNREELCLFCEHDYFNMPFIIATKIISNFNSQLVCEDIKIKVKRNPLQSIEYELNSIS